MSNEKILFFLFTCALTIGSVQAQEAADSKKSIIAAGTVMSILHSGTIGHSWSIS